MAINNCPFCDIVKGIKSVKRLYDSEKVIAFNDEKPVAPIHILIIPKKHYPTLAHIEDDELRNHLFKVATLLGQAFFKQLGGYQLHVNVGKEGVQKIYHAHIHLLAGKALMLTEWDGQ